MYREQAVEIPSSRQMTIDMPHEIPADGESCPMCAKYADPVTGELRFNAETIVAFEEGVAMERGEIPANHYHSVDEIWKELGL